MDKVKIGQINHLKVLKKVTQGFYLEGDEDWPEILLPRVLADPSIEVDDEVEVFIHFDSKDMIVATPQKPLAQVGDFVSLEVASVEKIGVFMDWGLDKDLFIPFREQLFKMEPGKSYVVHLYLDKSLRIVGSTRLAQFVDKSKAPFREGQEVDLLLYQKTEMGVKAIVNNQYAGLIYNDDIRSDLKLGASMKGYIKKNREDHKLDLSLQPPGLRGRKDLSEQIMDQLREAGGHLPITAKTPAEEISQRFGVSRKKFKVALGFLYKNQKITIDDEGMSLVE